MKRLTKDDTATNVEAMLNFAYAADREVKLAYADGEENITLAEYLSHLAKKKGCDCSLDDILNGDACGCDCGCDCYVNVLNTVAIQAAELRARLKAIEDILGDEYDLERLKHLLTGDNFTQKDMDASFTSGFENGLKHSGTMAQIAGKAIDLCRSAMETGLVEKAVDIAAANLEPVVRCKDCVRWPKAKVNSQGLLICPTSGMAIMANDFCSKGEGRRADG